MTYHLFYDFIFVVVTLNLHDVVTEVESFKSVVLAEKHHDWTGRPVKTVAKKLPINEKILFRFAVLDNYLHLILNLLINFEVLKTISNANFL